MQERGHPFQDAVARVVAAGIIDLLKDVHIRQDQSEAAPVFFIQAQELVEGAAVQQLRQTVVLRLMLHQYLPFLIFLVDAVIGLRQRPQLRCPVDGGDDAVADALVILQQGAHDAAADDHALQQHHCGEERHADGNGPENAGKHICRLLLPCRQCVGEHGQSCIHVVAFWQRLRYFCRLYLQSSQELHRLQSGVDDHTRLPRTSGLARHTDNAEAMWSGLRTFCTLMMIGAWSIASQWDAGANALTLAAISCVLYSAVAAPFKSLSLLMRTLVLLSLFSFVVKFGLMVQISDLWQFLLFLFPLLATMQLLKLQMPKFAALWGQLIVFMGSFIAVTNPPVYDFADFLNDNLAKIVGVALAWLAFAILRPGSDARKSRRHIRALRRDFVDQLSRHPTLSESEFESLTYHHVSQLSNSQDALARRWLLRWGVVLLNCSHVVWQLRDWESRSDPLSRVRDNCISLLRGVMSERGVQQKSLAATLEELQRICDSLARHHQPAARELAAIVWRLYCSLSQLEQAPPQGTLAS